MKPPCELVVSKILPSIRAAIVRILVNEHKMKQTEISAILGITQSAISQYTTSTRAADEYLYRLFPEIEEYAREIADKIVKEGIRGDQISLCIPCMSIRKSKKFCEYHKQFSKLNQCKICYVNSSSI